MKFGPVPTADALGAILAHSLKLPGGRLRKGRVLSLSDINAISGAGLAEVTVARLDDADLDEDTAATRIAQALTEGGDGVSLSPASTGRVNVLADGPGLARIDADAVDALNRVHPMITLATVAPLYRMDPRGLIATIKIIAYGVPSEAVTRATEAARNAVGLHAPVIPDVALIETRVGDTDPGDKGEAALQARLVRLGVAYAGRKIVPHETEELAEALRNCYAKVICVLTGSATSDIADTAPAALRAAGGQVDHFGMPVDPGNLLFLGHLGSRPVIGLPGCARSPALNGADWVLERILCGLGVSSADITTMGVGGLLKEIPSRPRPRMG